MVFSALGAEGLLRPMTRPTFEAIRFQSPSQFQVESVGF